MHSRFLKLGLAAAAMLVAAPIVSANSVNLTLVVNTSNNTWTAFASLTDPNSAGLAGMQFDVTATGGVTLATTGTGIHTNDLPSGQFSDGTGVGFNLLKGGTFTSTDDQFRGGQGSQSTVSPDGTGNTSVILGFGQTAGNYTGEAAAGLGGNVIPGTWAAVAKIANGVYSGTGGSISISGSSDLITLLPSAATVNSGNPFSDTTATTNGDTVTGQTVTVGAVPEPSSLLGGAVLAGLIVLRKRKTA